MSNTTNIGRNTADKSYRYKMPKLQTKIEGRGNGIKTVIPNMADIARALQTDPGYPTKFFGIELGAQSKYDTKRDVAIVNGAHQTIDLVTLLDKFIDQFILCPNCRLPEITMEVKPKSGTIKVDCRACGHNSPLKTTHKLSTFIINNPPVPKKASSEKDPANGFVAQKAAPKKGGKGKKDDSSSGSDQEKEKEKEDRKSEDDDEEEEQPPALISHKTEEVEWFTDASDEAAEKRKAAEMEEIRSSAKVDAILASKAGAGSDSPSEALRQYVNSGVERSAAEVAAELRRLQLARGFNDQQRLSILLEALIDPTKFDSTKSNPSTQFAKYSKVLAQFSQGKAAALTLIGAIESFLDEPYASKMPPIIKALYDSDILTEDQVVSWYESPVESSPLANKKLALALRKSIAPIVEWLKNAEEESDED